MYIVRGRACFAFFPLIGAPFPRSLLCSGARPFCAPWFGPYILSAGRTVGGVYLLRVCIYVYIYSTATPLWGPSSLFLRRRLLLLLLLLELYYTYTCVYIYIYIYRGSASIRATVIPASSSSSFSFFVHSWIHTAKRELPCLRAFPFFSIPSFARTSSRERGRGTMRRVGKHDDLRIFHPRDFSAWAILSRTLKLCSILYAMEIVQISLWTRGLKNKRVFLIPYYQNNGRND